MTDYIELSARQRALILIALKAYLALIESGDDLNVVISEAKTFNRKHILNNRSLKELIVKFKNLQDDPVFSKLF